MREMKHTQYKPANGHQVKLATFTEASFHRNVSPVAFGGWSEVERVTGDMVMKGGWYTLLSALII